MTLGIAACLFGHSRPAPCFFTRERGGVPTAFTPKPHGGIGSNDDRSMFGRKPPAGWRKQMGVANGSFPERMAVPIRPMSWWTSGTMARGTPAAGG